MDCSLARLFPASYFTSQRPCEQILSLYIRTSSGSSKGVGFFFQKEERGVALLREGRELSCFFSLLFSCSIKREEKKKVLGSFFLLVFKRELLRGWQGKKPKRRREPFRFESVLALEERREW